MIKIRVPLIRADCLVNKVSFSEESCKKIVEDFKATKVLPVSLLSPQTNMAFLMGQVTDLFYDETKKLLSAEVVLFLQFGLGGTPLTKLDTPEGVRVSEFKVEGLGVTFNFPQPKEESKIITPK